MSRGLIEARWLKGLPVNHLVSPLETTFGSLSIKDGGYLHREKRTCCSPLPRFGLLGLERSQARQGMTAPHLRQTIMQNASQDTIDAHRGDRLARPELMVTIPWLFMDGAKCFSKAIFYNSALPNSNDHFN